METTLHLSCCMSWVVHGNRFTRITMYVTYCPLKQLHTNYYVRCGLPVQTGLHLLDYQIALETTRDLRKGKQTFHNVFIVIFTKGILTEAPYVDLGSPKAPEEGNSGGLQ